MSIVTQGFDYAKARYAEIGVDVEDALSRMDEIPVSIHCWQGDDVAGFESFKEGLTGGIATTGHYPGKARNAEELRADIDQMLAFIPGKNKLNVHASYLETGGKRVDRDEILPEHYKSWADWAVERKLGLDFNPTTFSHPKGADGYSLSHKDKGIREFWIEHCKRSRTIADYFGARTGQTAVNNIWVHDGEKEFPADSLAPRLRLIDSLDRVLEEKMDPKNHVDALESKLFGIGSEAYVVGSSEFYTGYVARRSDVLLTLDTGHFHPTETVHSKISALLMFVPGMLLHVSRPVRWDSDHVVALDDETQMLMQEVVLTGALSRVHIALDYFDASINRIMAWIVGVRNTKKALLEALLTPGDTLKELEREGDVSARLAVREELKSMPFGAVWDGYCEWNGMPAGMDYLEDVRKYERDVLLKR